MINLLESIKIKRKQKKNMLYQRVFIDHGDYYSTTTSYIKVHKDWGDKAILFYLNNNPDYLKYGCKILNKELISEYQENKEKKDKNNFFNEFHLLPFVTHFGKRGKFMCFKEKVKVSPALSS